MPTQTSSAHLQKWLAPTHRYLYIFVLNLSKKKVYLLTSAGFPRFLTKHGLFYGFSLQVQQTGCAISQFLQGNRGGGGKQGLGRVSRGCCLLFSCRVCLTANRINETPGIDAIKYFAAEAENYIMKKLNTETKSRNFYDTVLSTENPTAQL